LRNIAAEGFARLYFTNVITEPKVWFNDLFCHNILLIELHVSTVSLQGSHFLTRVFVALSFSAILCFFSLLMVNTMKIQKFSSV